MKSNSSYLKRSLSVKQEDMNGAESPLHNFVKAKKKINQTFDEIGKYLEESSQFLCGCEISDENKDDVKGFASDVSVFLGQSKEISRVLARNHMKVAFFGRTSNGKSTVVNAMLHDRILPTGIGHTTNCFLSVHGSDSSEPYILIPESEERRNVKSLGQLAHALYEQKLEHSSLVQVFWPKTRCKMLSEDVVLVDSPGIDVSPDLDSWIDNHCLDADVFVLVCNAESTLMQTEKKFFHKVNERLSRPNIFILNNRWDAAAAEPEMMDLVKNQHLERNVSFLGDELKCVSKSSAKDRVFFVSAKETLTSRMQRQQGMPEGGAAIYVEGFRERIMEFENFEHKFEECISKSAIRTKFEAHAVRGAKIATAVKTIMEQTVGCAFQQRKKLLEAKKAREDRLEYVKEQLDLCSHEVKQNIKEIACQVERQVADAMTEEIGRLGVLVNEFEHPFHPHQGFLRTYKKELHEHIEQGLGRNLTARCSNSLTQVIEKSQAEMSERMQGLLPPESPEQNILPSLASSSRRDFEVSYPLDVHTLCSAFQEDIEFHFSLGWSALVRKFLAPHNARLAMALGANVQKNVTGLVPAGYSITNTNTRERTLAREGAPTRQGHGEVAPARSPYSDDELALTVMSGIATLTSRTTYAVVIVGGLVWRTVGWKLIVCVGGLYTGLYLFERLRWTNTARERAFKKQFVEYASEKLQLIVSVTSSNCSSQIQQQLSSTFAQFSSLVTSAKETLEDEILELSSEITRLEELENKAKLMRNRATWFESELTEFIKEFGLDKSKI